MYILYLVTLVLLHVHVLYILEVVSTKFYCCVYIYVCTHGMCAYYVLAVRCILCETPSQILFFLYIYTAGLKSFTFPVFLYNIIINHYYNNAVNAAYTFLPYNYILYIILE